MACLFILLAVATVCCCVVVVATANEGRNAMVKVAETVPASKTTATNEAGTAATTTPHSRTPVSTQLPTSSKTTNAFRCQRSIETLTSFSTKDAKGFQIDALDTPGSPGKRNANCMFDFMEVINASFTINCYRNNTEAEEDAAAASSSKDGCYANIKFHARVPDEFTAGDSLTPTIDDEARFDLRLENLMPVEKTNETEEEFQKQSESEKILNSVRNAIHYKGTKEDPTVGDHAGYSVCCALLDDPHSSCDWISTPATDEQDFTKRLVPNKCGVHELVTRTSVDGDIADGVDDNDDEVVDQDDPLGLNAITAKYQRKLREAARRLEEKNEKPATNTKPTCSIADRHTCSGGDAKAASDTAVVGDVNEVAGYHIISGSIEKPLHRDRAGIWRAELNFHRAPILSAKSKALANNHPSYADMSIKSGKVGRIAFSIMLNEEEMGKGATNNNKGIGRGDEGAASSHNAAAIRE